MAAHKLIAVASVVCVLVIAACGARSTLKVGGGTRATGGSLPTGGSGGTADGGGGFGGLGGGGEGGGGTGGVGGFGGGPGECVVFNSVAALAPADLFMVLDTSGSMDFLLGNGTTKWDAVTGALGTFFADQDSAGMDASLSFFPILNNSVQPYCFTDAECGAPSTCFPRKVCPNALRGCFTDQDCANFGFPGDTCQELGRCVGEPGPPFCVASGDAGLTCNGGGTCTPTGGCDNRFTCDAGTYQSSQSGLVSLPQGAGTLQGILDSQALDGGTPTLPAVNGVIASAIGNSIVNPTHKSFVVLVTDGFPTVCDPDLYGATPDVAIDNIAGAASAGALQDVQTFVIGVFTPVEQLEAEQNLGQIAAAGGTSDAFIISTQSNVSAELLLAMNEVRAEVQACEFELVTNGEMVDFNTVWVRVFPDVGDPVWVEFVGSFAGCDAVTGGFYYDVPPSQGTPSRVVLCPQSCDLLLSSENPMVEVFTACDPTDKEP
jgi:hypothetical protein